MTDIVERLRKLSRCNTHLMDSICECDEVAPDGKPECRMKENSHHE